MANAVSPHAPYSISMRGRVTEKVKELNRPTVTKIEETNGPPTVITNSLPLDLKRCNIRHHRLQHSEMQPLEEAVKMELQSMPSKTPVSVLQELLSRRGTIPKYELVQVEGAIHEPTFRYRVTVGDSVAMGTGRSKKEAKHSAAKSILDCLTGNADGTVLPNPPIQDPKSSVGNPIGLLQELCMSRRWPPPAYKTEFEEGLPHERQFTISCVVFKHKETGTGKSKKIAKRLAAQNMWHRLKSIPFDKNSPHWNEGLDDDELLARRYMDSSNNISEWEDLRTSKISTLTPQQTIKISQFHKNLKSSEGPKLNELQNITLSSEINYVQFLKEIGAEQEFVVAFVDIEEKSMTGKSQCLVQLSTFPVAVCHGSGTTPKEAQALAALAALEYLKLMTKK